MFRQLPRAPKAEPWTLTQGFFADMGGFTLSSPDSPPFPINGEQLHYLILHGYVDHPELSKADLEKLNKVDGLARLLTFWQVLWFTATELQRAKEGLPMSTLELTTLAYSITTMFALLCWLKKPTISTSITLHTKNGATLSSIRQNAKLTVSIYPGRRLFPTPRLQLLPPVR